MAGEDYLGSFAYVNESVNATMVAIEGIFGFDAEINPELGHVGTPLFGSELAPDSHDAISEALDGVTLEFVPDRQSVVDHNAGAHLGCRPYLGGNTMLHLSAPLARLDGSSLFYVAVNIDRGCEGATYLLEVAPALSGYGVIRVVSESAWIV